MLLAVFWSPNSIYLVAPRVLAFPHWILHLRPTWQRKGISKEDVVRDILGAMSRSGVCFSRSRFIGQDRVAWPTSLPGMWEVEFVEPVAAPTPPITIRFHMDTHLAALFLGLHHPRALFPAQIYLSVSCPLTSASCLSMPLVIPLPPETWLFCFVFFGHPSFPWLNCPLPGSLPSLPQLGPILWAISAPQFGLLRKLTHSPRDQCHSRLQTSNPATLKAWPPLPTGHPVTTQFPQTPSATCQSSSF